MASSKPFSELPLELLCEVIKFLPLTDLQTLSLVSRLIRSQAIHFIFGHLRYTYDLIPKVRNIHQARRDVKAVIKFAPSLRCYKWYKLSDLLQQKTRTNFRTCIYWKWWTRSYIPIPGILAKFASSQYRSTFSTCISLWAYLLHPTHQPPRTHSFYWLAICWRTPYGRSRWPGETLHSLACEWHPE